MTKLEQKTAYWKRSLLDLGRRNRMIHYRETRYSTLRLLAPSYADLYRLLVLEEKRLTMQYPLDTAQDAPMDDIVRLMESANHPLRLMLGDVTLEGSPAENRAAMKNMRAKNKLAHEEQGINILYLSIGFLQWRESPKDDWTRSPLVLIPARLLMENVRAPFVLEKSSDDVVSNPSLAQLLKQNFQIELPIFTPDENSIDAYLDAVEKMAESNGWQVIREASLGLMSFLKINMYRDIENNQERIFRSEILRAIAGDTPYSPVQATRLRSVDSDAASASECFQVVNADSSQQDAIALSRSGVSFMLQGPPGTGKSQTITNIIAQGLADGRKILFVSEKMAALQVVYRRLQETGLSDFCLPLHSRKADKKDILKDISETLEIGRVSVTQTAMSELAELDAVRQSLNEYPRLLHERHQPLDCSLYQAFGELAASVEVPEISFHAPISCRSVGNLQENLRIVERFAHSVEQYRLEKSNPWEGFCGYCASFSARRQLEYDLQKAQSALAAAEPFLVPPAADGILDLNTITAPEADTFYQWCVRTQKIRPVPECWLDLSRYAALRDDVSMESEAQSAFLERQSLCARSLKNPEQHFDTWLTRYHGLETILKPTIRVSSPQWLNTIEEKISMWETSVHRCAELLDYANQVGKLLGCSIGRQTEMEHSFRILEALSHCAFLSKELLQNGGIPQLQATLASVRMEATILAEREQTILQSWESDVLSFDCVPMLNRFKAEYTGLFKVFKRQYKEDKRFLRLLAKGDAVHMDDDAILVFLQKLKEFREDKAHWQENAHPIANALGMDTLSLDADWNALSRGLANLEKLRSACSLCNMLNGVCAAIDTQDNYLEQGKALCDGAWDKKYAEFMRTLRSLMPKKSLLDLSQISLLLNTTLQAMQKIRELLAEIAPLFVPNTTYEQMFLTVAAACERDELQRQMLERAERNQQKFGKTYNGIQTDWLAVADMLEETHALSEQAAALDIPETFAQEVLCTENVMPTYDNICLRAGNAFRAFAQAMENIYAHFDAEKSPANINLVDLDAWLQNCLSHMNALDVWTEYREAREAFRASAFAPMEDVLLNSHLPYAQWRAVAQKQFYTSWIDEQISHTPALAQFRAEEQSQKIQRFRELDEEQLHIARGRIRAKLIDRIQTLNRNMLSANDELAILRHELTKRRAHMPLRKLFSQIPNLLLTLKPCLMMSPLSVSYFLEAQTYDFDMVIFDEASQIMPEDAIGAILRGKQVIIAGDTKQLPPTNFFALTMDSDTDFSDEEDGMDDCISESILEEAACALPTCSLLWHYRSRHENLIAFSNHEMYGNKLVTFPSSVNKMPDLGVEFVSVKDGIYEARQNLREAETCVQLLEEHILKHPDRSLGIIAFSESQQSLIEETVLEFRQEHPQYEFFFDESQDEPFFVKNLENVQGDERDVIIFSIGYARRANGTRVNLNFGPLSKAGGERRLNVAITRAKINVKIVSSIQPSDIDLNRAKSEGARMLRAYLEFALYGSSSLMQSDGKRKSITRADDPFIERLAGILTSRGYSIERSVGYSEYTIDIAVRNPEQPNCYSLGIECDGEDYAMERTARDRDHLRPNILMGMGWKIYSVWSTEWFKHSEAVESALLKAVDTAIHEPPVIQESSPTQRVLTEDFFDEELPAQPVSPLSLAEYVEAEAATPDVKPLKKDALAQEILRIVRIEQPVHRDVLYHKLNTAMGYDKISLSVRSQIEVELRKLSPEQVELEGDFVQCAGFHMETPRKAGSRTMDMISYAETRLVFQLVLENSIGISKDDLFAESIRLLGFERRSPKITRVLEVYFQKMEEEGTVRCMEGKVQKI